MLKKFKERRQASKTLNALKQSTQEIQDMWGKITCQETSNPTAAHHYYSRTFTPWNPHTMQTSSPLLEHSLSSTQPQEIKPLFYWDAKSKRKETGALEKIYPKKEKDKKQKKKKPFLRFGANSDSE